MSAKTRLALRLWQAGRRTKEDVLGTLGTDPTIAELVEVAEAMGVHVSPDASAEEIVTAIGG